VFGASRQPAQFPEKQWSSALAAWICGVSAGADIGPASTLDGAVDVETTVFPGPLPSALLGGRHDVAAREAQLMASGFRRWTVARTASIRRFNLTGRPVTRRRHERVISPGGVIAHAGGGG